MQQNILVISNYANLVSPRPEAELFIRLFEAGYPITIMCPESSPWRERFEEVGIPLIFFSCQKKYDKKEVQFIRQTLDERDIDILILFNNKAVVNGIQAAKGHPVKVVVYRGSVGNVHWWDPTSYLKVLHPRVDSILCLHEAVKKHLDKQFIFRSTPKTFVIHKGHDPKWYEDVKPLSREEMGLSDKDFCVIFVGNVRRVKGIRYLLDATQKIADLENLHLLLIGRGFDKRPYKKRIENSPMRERIHLYGFRADALQMVASSDVFTLPSLRSEALTKAVQEAMHLGICPVITDIPGNKGLVISGESGFVVPIRDASALAGAFKTLYEDREKTKIFGLRAKERIRAFLPIEKGVEEMKRFVEELSIKNNPIKN